MSVLDWLCAIRPRTMTNDNGGREGGRGGPEVSYLVLFWLLCPQPRRAGQLASSLRRRPRVCVCVCGWV